MKHFHIPNERKGNEFGTECNRQKKITNARMKFTMKKSKNWTKAIEISNIDSNNKECIQIQEHASSISMSLISHAMKMTNLLSGLMLIQQYV